MTPGTKSDIVKVGCAWCAVSISSMISKVAAALGINGWGEASQAAAFVLSMLLIGDFFWKRFFRKFAERRWPRTFPRRRKRRSDFADSTDNAPLGER